MAVISRPLLRDSSLRDSSSMANTTPASGALKAAAMPAAPPATSRPWLVMAERGPSQRRASCITPAATCTDGPSRPIDSPARKPAAPSTIFAKVRRSETKRRRSVLSTAASSAAITCGMPEPAAPGAKRRVAQTMAAVQAGVHSSTAQPPCQCNRRSNRPKAPSASSVNATTLRPEAMAYASTMARSAHCRPLPSSSCRFLRKSGWEGCMAKGRPLGAPVGWVGAMATLNRNARWRAAPAVHAARQ